jgi:hypothetical protein
MIVEDEAYLQFLRERGCIWCGAYPPNDPDHLRNRKWRNSTRNDYTAVSACRNCHTTRHNIGTLAFMDMRGMRIADLVEAVATQLVAYHAQQHQRRTEAL